MKRFILTLTTIFICTIAYAHTINWHVGNTILETTTCDSGESITPPNAPYKYGYHFVSWDDYTPIEYLESTGTQYINTNYIADVNTNITIKFSDIKTWILGSVELTGMQDDFGIAANIIRFGTQYIRNLDFSNNIYTINVNKNGYTINGNETHWQQIPEMSCKKNVFLFWANGSSAAKSGKIYYTKIYDNDVLVRDFIPVLDKNGVPCMYDRVEKKFYYNAGTGQFVAGPVIGE